MNQQFPDGGLSHPVREDNRTLTEYKCPVCTGFLTSTPGHAIDRTDGVTLSCPTPIEKCGMADWAHGKTAKDAFEIFKQKCGVTGR